METGLGSGNIDERWKWSLPLIGLLLSNFSHLISLLSYYYLYILKKNLEEPEILFVCVCSISCNKIPIPA